MIARIHCKTNAAAPSFTPVRTGVLQRKTANLGLGTRNDSFGPPINHRVLQRKCACGGMPGPTGECEGCRKKREAGTLQRQADGPAHNPQSSNVPAIVHEVLRSPGQSLDPATRAFVEPRFRHDFSQVRVHTDAKAAESALAVHALAYTVGSSVVFGPGQYAPGTGEGGRLLAHELAHVIQQRDAVPRDSLQMGRRDDSSEREARNATGCIFTLDASARPSCGIAARPMTLARGEKWDAFWGVGPWDAYKAKQLADKALSEAQKTGLPGLHNGPADAWRHCYWNCTMTGELGADQAKLIADNHEKHGGGASNENTMDYHNNDKGRSCGGKSCDLCCQTKLNSGELLEIDAMGTVVPSSPKTRPMTPSSGSGGYKY